MAWIEEPTPDPGRDLHWPEGLAAHGGVAAVVCPDQDRFAAELAGALALDGYCRIHVPPYDKRSDFVRLAQERLRYTALPHGLQEVYLGLDSLDEVAWLAGDEFPPEEEFEGQVVAHYVHHLECLLALLTSVAAPMLGVVPSGESSRLMLRRSARVGREASLRSEPLTEDDLETEVVKDHLRFVQSQRLCVMYFVDVAGGDLDLYPRPEGHLPHSAVRLPVANDTIAVFRSDRMSFSYRPRSGGLVLQTWLAQQAAQYVVKGFEGSQQEVQRLLGGPPVPLDRQVHVMSVQSKFNGSCRNVQGCMIGWSMGVQGTIEIPLERFDISLYYSETEEIGKIGTKHQSLLPLDDWSFFDNEFFGIEDDVAMALPAASRVLLEESMEAFIKAGCSKASLRGTPVAVVIGTCGLDNDSWFRFRETPEAWLQTKAIDSSIGCTRLSQCFGLTGPCFQVDTACSSTLTSVIIGHGYLRKRDNKGLKTAISMGSQNDISVFPLIGMYSAHMIGPGGRCKFGDNSANGFNQGEGTGGIIQMCRDDVQAIQDRFASLSGTFLNQDGRSASLTAPNGPSQQLCVRGSLADSGLTPADITLNENHGTGTALGDPIEVGSVAATFRRRELDRPMGIASKKAHNSHLVSTAGSVSIIAAITAGMHSCQCPQVHLRQLNMNMDVAGFPMFIPIELCNTMTDHMNHGVSSFGFGGTNARADVWARTMYGPSKSNDRRLLVSRAEHISEPCPRCLGPMCMLCKAALPTVGGEGRHRCSMVRANHASYEYCSHCYHGDYALDLSYEDEVTPLAWGGHQVYVVGTWDAWSTFHEMDLEPQGGYSASVVLGETRTEQFYIVLDQDSGKALFPGADRAGQRLRPLGPGANKEGNCWSIDGRRGGASAGDVYKVRLTPVGRTLSVSWERTSAKAESTAYKHSYSIIGSITSWEVRSMARSSREKGLWTFEGRLDSSGHALFQLLRDGDRRQALYPLRSAPADLGGAIMGPGPAGPRANWSAWGAPGEPLTVKLRARGRDFEITATTAEMGSVTWQSGPEVSEDVYSLAGSWSGSGLVEMHRLEGTADIYAARFVMEHSWEEFQILVNHDWDMVLYPSSACAPPGEGLVCGPDGRSDGLKWRVVGPAGLAMEVRLSLGAEDNCAMVTCTLCDDLEEV